MTTLPMPTLEQLEACRDIERHAAHARRHGMEVPADWREAEASWEGGWGRMHAAHRRGVPRRLWNACLDSCDETPAIVRARQYVAEDVGQGRALTFLGPTGTGKSFAAAWTLATVRGGRFAHVPEIARQLFDFDEQAELFESLASAPLLVLDDLGAEYLKAGGMLEALLDELIWRREAESLATILTSNLTPDSLAARIGDRAWDRLVGPWGSLFVVKGSSRRQAQARRG